jgi:transposase-like protein
MQIGRMQKDTERRRRRWSAAEKRSAIQGWESSGLSAREYAKREGLPTANLWNWKRSLTKAPAKRATRESITFAPVHVRGGAALIRAEAADTQRVSMELSLDGGVRIRVFAGADMRALSELVASLSGRSTSC